MIQDRIDKIEATVTQAANLPGETRQELLKLLAELKAEVAPLTATHDEDASSIARFTDASVHEATRTAADWKIIRDMLTRFYGFMEFAPKTVTTLATHVHAKFPSTEERDEWLGRFSYSPLIARAGALGYVRIADWEKDIRVLIEQSNSVPDGVFIVWETQFTNEQDWETFLASLPTMMENAANLFFGKRTDKFAVRISHVSCICTNDCHFV